MGESACLVRSFSQPAEMYSHESEGGDPVRALTESVSFGRFMSESLAWEKWSAFSHNRYLEEAEKITKPGSVAQKKAFFEAHYKKRAAMRMAQEKLEEANVAIHGVPGDDNSVGIQKENTIGSKVSEMATTGMVNEEVRLGEICSIVEDEDRVVDVNSCNFISQIQVKSDVETGEVKDNSMENIEQHEFAERFVVAVSEVKVLNEGNPTSSSKEKRASSSSGSKASEGRLRLKPSCARELECKGSEKDATSSSKKSKSVTQKQKRLTLESNNELLQMPQRRSPKSGTSAMAGVKSDKKKRAVPSSVHKSFNFTSSRRQMSNTEPKDPIQSLTMQGTTSSRTKSTPRSSAITKAATEVDKKKRSLPSLVHVGIVLDASPRHKVPIRSSTRLETTSSKAKYIAMSGITAKAAGEADRKSKTGQKVVIRSSTTTEEANSSKVENNALPMVHRAWKGTTSSFCTSANLGSHVSGTIKTSPRAPKDDLNTARCSASASVTRIPKLPLKNHSSEDKRKDTIIGSSISVRIPNNEPKQSCDNPLKLSTPNGIKARSCTVSSPFSFQSEERAAKRKEFFKKLEEKNKNEEADKDRSLSGLKIPVTRLGSPRQYSNRSLGLNNNGKPHRPPQKISSVIATNTENAAGEKQRSSKIHPPTPKSSLLKRKTRENLSPNIQQ